MTIRKPAVPVMTVCAWCERILAEGVGPVSHGICDSCVEQLLLLADNGDEPGKVRGPREATRRRPVRSPADGGRRR
jgi:hypothetical protein